MTQDKDGQIPLQESEKIWAQKEKRNSRSDVVNGYNSKHLPLRDETCKKNYITYKILAKCNFKSDTTHGQPSHRRETKAEIAWI